MGRKHDISLGSLREVANHSSTSENLLCLEDCIITGTHYDGELHRHWLFARSVLSASRFELKTMFLATPAKYRTNLVDRRIEEAMTFWIVKKILRAMCAQATN